MHLAHQEDDLDCRRDPAEEVRGRGRGGDGPEQRVAEHEAETLADVVDQLGVASLGHPRLGLRRTNGGDGPGGGEEAQCIDGYRCRAPDGLDEAAGDARACHGGHLGAAGEFGVSLDEMLPSDQGGQVRLIGDVEEHGQDPAGQRDDEELRQRETAEGIGDRDDPSASTRPRSATIITRRRRMRSTHTPAGSPTTRKAAVDAAVNRPISKVVACNVRTAKRGMARRLTCEPSSLTVSPAHRRRSRDARNNTPLGTGGP